VSEGSLALCCRVAVLPPENFCTRPHAMLAVAAVEGEELVATGGSGAGPGAAVSTPSSSSSAGFGGEDTALQVLEVPKVCSAFRSGCQIYPASCLPGAWKHSHHARSAMLPLLLMQGHCWVLADNPDLKPPQV
jgi:hypothetical protein